MASTISSISTAYKAKQGTLRLMEQTLSQHYGRAILDLGGSPKPLPAQQMRATGKDHRAVLTLRVIM
tara:strand:- start:979 stop:1179 length:201 start_codon:yes stop_codon:yes gene_type:complete